MRKSATALCQLAAFLFAVTTGSIAALAADDQDHDGKSGGTADHAKFEELKKDFASGPEVTKACLSCHNKAGDQVMHSIHWKWEFQNEKTGQTLGKSHVINAFCGNVAANEPRCTSCHVGYGWTDMAAGPPKDETKVDCLACHDRTGTYTKIATAAGAVPVEPVSPTAKTITGAKAVALDLGKIARSVGLPQRENCGQCHFYGGGGDNVKHGDLSSVLFQPTKAVDVHMDKDGLNFACSKCHVSNEHQWAGSRYDVKAIDTVGTGKPGARRDVATCESCHGASPHPIDTVAGIKLNNHTGRVACQTCHIPSFARGGVATKTKWDWSTAGKLKEGAPYHEEDFTQSDGQHLHTYLSTKGDFEWGENVTPYYAWFDGQVRYTLADETIDPTKTVEINRIKGSPDDPNSRIWPFKRMEGRQAYDAKLNHLVYNHVFGPETDSAFWTNFDWDKAIKAAMEHVGVEYSGDYGFVDTHMYWPITHMVAPKEDALACAECHARDGRLASLAGFYMPGRDHFSWLDIIGYLAIAGALGGVILHGLARVMMRGRTKH
ncbi:tetrathionate reductase family octaheme c-type cytochrome [Rhodobium gokarnense]|uniref:Octaheme c-type cytochrome (Tetrathionate reductase family) n=1 Tax=Rhodobium gokarnense TaxID=364296 RepID=A0ABT3HCB7_9HYPH|nr:tetrathionate reductase family octaheme c-type cytochrome [Rhodobium gokarnense]MCW2308043.1 octaheme c-type cytochrome (tetrathionate reductase family) [Rhodobium gokarnense]